MRDLDTLSVRCLESPWGLKNQLFQAGRQIQLAGLTPSFVSILTICKIKDWELFCDFSSIHGGTGLNVANWNMEYQFVN